MSFDISLLNIGTVVRYDTLDGGQEMIQVISKRDTTIQLSHHYNGMWIDSSAYVSITGVIHCLTTRNGTFVTDRITTLVRPLTPEQRDATEGLSELQQALMVQLQDGPQTTSAIAKAMNKPAAAVNSPLTGLIKLDLVTVHREELDGKTSLIWTLKNVA